MQSPPQDIWWLNHPRARQPSPIHRPLLEHIARAKQIAGKQWAGEAAFFCISPRANSPTDPLIEPAKLFDNLYAFGRSGTVVYAITTTAGIILIDSGYANEVENVLISQMKSVGLDPAQVKMIILTHGHGNHFGGALIFRITTARESWNRRLTGI